MKRNTLLYPLLITLFLVSCGTKKTVRQSVKKPSKTALTSSRKKPVSITSRTQEYIKKYQEVAMKEMRKFGIPASITLAQGILESGSGYGKLTQSSNNHFGIKCHKGWRGKRVYHDDDRKGECFRVYKHPEKSYRDHSLFLANRERYADLFRLKKADYKGWARGLSRAGYATDRRYPAKLIALIEKYELYRYDKKVLGRSYKRQQAAVKAPKRGRTHVVAKGETLYAISRKYGLTVAALKRMNDLDSDILSIGQRLRIKK
ncbi:MAG: glucosaminidase domain-containing protein [Lutibacter sp.]|jgi:flagellum-specific peptidoglycan hydrolase FlgJ|nr:glucosaminidase domain-containing protein [Lutibacter sp.]